MPRQISATVGQNYVGEAPPHPAELTHPIEWAVGQASPPPSWALALSADEERYRDHARCRFKRPYPPFGTHQREQGHGANYQRDVERRDLNPVHSV